MAHKFIPAGAVTLLSGNGGDGKSTVALQIAISVALGRDIFGLSVEGGAVLGLFCEDDQEELERRGREICAAEGIELESLDRFYPLSRNGMDNLLCTFRRDEMRLTPLHAQLEASIATIRPRLVILDTVADLFGGDFMNTAHVRQFLKVAIGGLCVRYDCAVLLIGHPSASGLRAGDGTGFSTAWNNSVRGRLFLRRHKSTNEEISRNRRVLEVKKSNYGPTDGSLALVYQDGRFAVDTNPVGEKGPPKTASATPTRLMVAAHACVREKTAAGGVVAFGGILEVLQAANELDTGEYETVRKQLQRALKQLQSNGLIEQCDKPRGYRLKAA